MKIAFHFPFETAAGAGPAAILAGAPASGTQSSIRLALALRERGHSVEVVHCTPGEPSSVDGVMLEYVGSTEDAAARLRSLGPDDTAILPPHDALAMLAALRGAPCAKLLWLHNNGAIDWAETALRLGAGRLVCVTRAASLMYRPYPFHDRVEVVPYSLRDAVALPPWRPVGQRVAFVGALTESKGFHHLLSAWPLVRQRVPDASLDVFGSAALHGAGDLGPSGVMGADFEARWWTRPLADAGIALHGALAKHALYEALSHAKVGVVNPNLTGSTETFCLSAVEMQACGVPCIGGGAGGLLDTISHDRSGFHLRTQSPDELARRIVQVLTQPELAGRLSRGALVHAARFDSPEREARDFEAVIARLRRGEPAPRQGWDPRDLMRLTGLGRIKLALKRRLRPEATTLAYRRI